jgi:hypothetical protein
LFLDIVEATNKVFPKGNANDPLSPQTTQMIQLALPIFITTINDDMDVLTVINCCTAIGSLSKKIGADAIGYCKFIQP